MLMKTCEQALQFDSPEQHLPRASPMRCTQKPCAMTRPLPFVSQMCSQSFLPEAQEALEEEQESWVIQMKTKNRNNKISQLDKPVMLVQFLTHPERGIQVGTRLHKSLMTRMMMTAESRWLTLAWRQRQKNYSVRWHAAHNNLLSAPENDPKKHSKESSRINKTPPADKQMHLYSRVKKKMGTPISFGHTFDINTGRLN